MVITFINIFNSHINNESKSPFCGSDIIAHTSKIHTQIHTFSYCQVIKPYHIDGEVHIIQITTYLGTFTTFNGASGHNLYKLIWRCQPPRHQAEAAFWYRFSPTGDCMRILQTELHRNHP